MEPRLHPRLVEHFGPLPSTLGRLLTNPASTEVSTRDTVRVMSQVATRTSQHPIVLRAVHAALAPLPQDATPTEQTEAIYRWVQAHVEFVEDEEILGRIWGYRPEEAELIVEPPRLLTMPRPMGDCDDQSTLLASMLLSLPVGVGFVTVAADPDEPERWSHVYVRVVLIDGSRLPLDVSHGSYPGWEETNVYRRKEWVVR